MYKKIVQELMKTSLSIDRQIAILKLLQKRGITSHELAEVIKILKNKMAFRLDAPDAIDLCGTGGSGLPRINTSTLAAFIVASLGVPVVKHGNKAASGRCGSFDLLERLGIGIDLNSKKLNFLIKNEGLAFVFARAAHPSMAAFAEARKRIGSPTLFNLVGPLLNPADPKRQIIGVADKTKMELMAETCRLLGKKHVFIVRGCDGLDEVTLTGPTDVLELKNKKIIRYQIGPEDFGIQRARPEEIRGGSVEKNAALARDILNGQCRTRHTDLVLINAALALKLAGLTDDLKKGYRMAREAVESGLALKKMKEYRQASRRNFKKIFKKNHLALIAEIKLASPSAGRIAPSDIDVGRQARDYETADADAISVVTEPDRFGGSMEFLKIAQRNTQNVPLLRKDFILRPEQIREARSYGADAVLLIASLLTNEQIDRFIAIASSLAMECLVEVHTEEELKRILKTKASVIGINQRDLRTFRVDRSVIPKLLPLIPKNKIVVAESGIRDQADVAVLPKRVNGMLVGTSIMKHPFPALKIKELKGQKLLKICGIRSLKEAKFCERAGVDMIGLNFVPTSRRRIRLAEAEKIGKNLKNIIKIGVFQNQPIEIVNRIAKEYGLDAVQLSGEENLNFIKKCGRPVIKGASIHSEEDFKKIKIFSPHVSYILLDSRTPGSGAADHHKILNQVSLPCLVAGGLHAKNLKFFLKNKNFLGFDVASGVETNGVIDFKKIKQILNLLKSCH